MKWNKAIIVSTMIALSFTLIACNGTDVLVEREDTVAEGDESGIENSDTKFPVESFNTKHGDLSMRIEEGTITPTGLTLIYENSGDKEYHYGSYYYIEKKEENQWTALPFIVESDVGWTGEAYIVLKDQPSEATIKWEWLYGSLPKGEYRIIKDVNDFRGTGDYDTFYQGVVFTIE